MNIRSWCTSRRIGRPITMGKQHFLKKFFPKTAPLFLQGNNNMSGLPLCARVTDELWYSEVSFHTRPGPQALGSVGHGTHSLVRWVQPHSQGSLCTSREPWNRDWGKRSFTTLSNKSHATEFQIHRTFEGKVRLWLDLFTRLQTKT